MREDEVMNITSKQMERIIAKAYSKSNIIPSYYPTVDYLDRLIYGENWQDDPKKMLYSDEWKKQPFFTTKSERAATFAYMIRHIVLGFERDDAWHVENPGKDSPTIGNIYDYIITPLKSGAYIEPHTAVWTPRSTKKEREDIQAGFEYMQGFMIDGSYFILQKPTNMRKYASASV